MLIVFKHYFVRIVFKSYEKMKKKNYRVSQKKHSYKLFGLEIMLFTCSQTLWSGLCSSFTKWGTAPASHTDPELQAIVQGLEVSSP